MIKSVLKRIIFFIIAAIVLCGICMMTINNHIVSYGKEKLIASVTECSAELTKEEKAAINQLEPQCAIVMGAGIIDENTPSYMLRDRLDVGIMLYKQGYVSKLLLTGDNGTETHNEIHVMLNYSLDAGIPADDIYCDHAGFSTYDSMYREKTLFDIERAIIVTQSYHEYRSLYIADKLGIDCIGVGSDQKIYGGQPVREIREVLARVKDYFKCIRKPESLIGGEAFSLQESGKVTHGE